MPIEGQVAEILDKYTLATNVGQEDGVEEGMEFEVYEEGPVITDPETGEELGQPETVKVTLVVKEVKEKMSIMKTPTTTIERNTLSEMVTSFKKYDTKQRKISTDEFVKDDRKKVSKGDPVRQVIEEDTGLDDGSE